MVYILICLQLCRKWNMYIDCAHVNMYTLEYVYKHICIQWNMYNCICIQYNAICIHCIHINMDTICIHIVFANNCKHMNMYTICYLFHL